MKKSIIARIGAVAGAAIMLASATAGAAELKMGTKLDLGTLDPHFFASFPTGTSHSHLYDRLINRDSNLTLKPGLAQSWTATGPKTWEIELRKGVTFHDGSAFDAEDVAATFRRIPDVPNSPNSFARYVRHFEKVEIVSPHLIRIHTKVPVPQLPRDMSQVVVISSEQENATTQEFNSGKAAIGTGPYKLVEWKKGQHMKMVRNDNYWGEKPEWEKVTEVVLVNGGARTAALLSGDVDVINYVPVADMKNIKASSKLKLVTGPIARFHYIAMDSNRDPTPHVSAGGKNPLKDARVRKAMSLAINRTAIVDRILNGVGMPASQILPPSFAGGNKDLKVDPYDPAAAKKLLADAGYPDGFEMTFHATNGRYPADVEIAQAVAQMWTKIGLKVEVDAMSRTIFFPKATKFEFSVYTAQYGSPVNLNMAVGMLHSRMKEKGLGNGNRARYSNAEVDKNLDAALVETDQDKINQLTSKAIGAAMAETGIIPLYYPGFAVALRSDLGVEIDAEGRNTAMRVSAAK